VGVKVGPVKGQKVVRLKSGESGKDGRVLNFCCKEVVIVRFGGGEGRNRMFGWGSLGQGVVMNGRGGSCRKERLQGSGDKK